MTDSRWTLPGSELLDMLRRAYDGEDPDLIYTEAYVNQGVKAMSTNDEPRQPEPAQDPNQVPGQPDEPVNPDEDGDDGTGYEDDPNGQDYMGASIDEFAAQAFPADTTGPQPA
ncbi:MAG TPA: hypothetical protein VE617_07410 [Propionibacteriaceae bacterium]|jgi:hypothetical protein|nr:hypothetical protein [Propionibacteriaceae bacterium]